uniref:Dehydrogenase E1 component domain-containing protein n=1 Tax=Daucus carota subsp. sativus TaxID=79200 RepID=A0A164XCG6_DAUCS
MGVGYSGAPVVNCGGFVVGMVTGGMTEVHHVMGTGPFVRYAGPHMDEIISENPEAVDSALTGPVIVDDVIYKNLDDDVSRLFPSEELIFRRLTFERSMGLVQSEAFLTREECKKLSMRKSPKNLVHLRNLEREGIRKENLPTCHLAPEIDHDYLASSYHTGTVSGLMLISSFLETVSFSGGKVKAAVIGLGAGLLPMFLHQSLQCLSIEVVELDAVILDLARDYFGYKESDHKKILEMDTYRNHDHFMSDPGSTYRTRDEISGIRQERDPIERIRKLILAHDIATEKELEDIEKEKRKEVDEAIAQAKESPMPDPSELFTNVCVKGFGIEV